MTVCCYAIIAFTLFNTMSLEDQTNLRRHAARNAQDAILLARERARAFDEQAAIDRKANEALSRANVGMKVGDDDDDSSLANVAPSAPIVDCGW